LRKFHVWFTQLFPAFQCNSLHPSSALTTHTIRENDAPLPDLVGPVEALEGGPPAGRLRLRLRLAAVELELVHLGIDAEQAAQLLEVVLLAVLGLDLLLDELVPVDGRIGGRPDHQLVPVRAQVVIARLLRYPHALELQLLGDLLLALEDQQRHLPSSRVLIQSEKLNGK